MRGLFCKRALSKRLYSAKETYHFEEPTNCSHPIAMSRSSPKDSCKFKHMSKWLQNHVKIEVKLDIHVWNEWIKSKVSFAEYSLFYRALLSEMSEMSAAHRTARGGLRSCHGTISRKSACDWIDCRQWNERSPPHCARCSFFFPQQLAYYSIDYSKCLQRWLLRNCRI